MSIARRVRTGRGLLAGAIAVLIAGAIALAMSSAQAEAASKTVTLTLTGMVDSSCQIATGGTTAYIAPGGTVTLKASLAGASVTLPGVPPLVPSTTIPLDSSQVASFSDVVTVNGKKHTLTKPTDTLVLKNIRATTTISWRATGVSLLGGLGYVPFTSSNVGLPAGGELDWSGKIVPSSNSNCGIGIALPTTKISAGGHTVTVPGAAVTVPNPVGAITSKVGQIVGKVTGAAGSKSGSGGSGSSGGSVNYTPPALTVPEKVMPNADAMGGSGKAGSSGSGSSNGLDGVAAGGGIGNAHEAAPGHGSGPSGANSSAAKKSVDLAQRFELGGKQLPALLAIAAIIALSIVTSVYTRMTLLRRR